MRYPAADEVRDEAVERGFGGARDRVRGPPAHERKPLTGKCPASARRENGGCGGAGIGIDPSPARLSSARRTEEKIMRALEATELSAVSGGRNPHLVPVNPGGQTNKSTLKNPNTTVIKTTGK